jgi:hypothetical protein
LHQEKKEHVLIEREREKEIKRKRGYLSHYFIRKKKDILVWISLAGRVAVQLVPC